MSDFIFDSSNHKSDILISFIDDFHKKIVKELQENNLQQGMINLQQTNQHKNLKYLLQKYKLKYNNDNMLITKAYAQKNNLPFINDIDQRLIQVRKTLIIQQTHKKISKQIHKQAEIYIIYYQNKIYQYKQDINKLNNFKDFFSKAHQIHLDKYKQILIMNRQDHQISQKPQTFQSQLMKINGQDFYEQPFKYNWKHLKDQFNSLNKDQSKFFQISIIKYYQKWLKQFKNLIIDGRNMLLKKLDLIYYFAYYFNNRVFSIVNYWHQPQSYYRIGLIRQIPSNISEISKYPNYYFYHQFQSVQINKQTLQFTIPSKFNQFKQYTKNNLTEKYDNIRLVKEILLSNLQRINVNQIMKYALISSLKKIQQQKRIEAQKLKRQKIKRFKDQSSKKFKQYQKYTIENFINNISQAYNKIKNKSQKYLCLSIGDLYLIEEFKYINMNCTIELIEDNKVLQKQIRKYKYQFDQNTDDWHVKLHLTQTQPKSIIFPLSKIKNKNAMILKFYISKYQKNKQNQSIMYAQISPIIDNSSKNIGRKQQVQFYQINNQQQILGFFDIFYIRKISSNPRLLQQSNLQMINVIKILKYIGSMPINYYQSIKFNYNPNCLQFYSNLFSGKKIENISKINFQFNYLQIIYFLQTQRKYKSRVKAIANSNIKQQSNIRMHFHPLQRLEEYSKIINFQQSRKSKWNKNVFLKEPYKANFKISYKLYSTSPLHIQTLPVLQILLLSQQKQITQTIKHINPYLLQFVNRIITIYKLGQNSDIRSAGSLTSNNHQISIDACSNFVISLIKNIYPYVNIQELQRDLLFIRYFVQKYLPNFNFLLNRKNIGIQNLASKYLLSFFSIDLEEQLTFQIWDFIILSQKRSSSRVVALLSLFIFLQKTNLEPIIPISIFVNALYDNYEKFDIGEKIKKLTQPIIQSIGKHFKNQHQRKRQIYKLKDASGKLLIGHQFVKKVMFDNERNHKVHVVGNRNISLNDLQYKLPMPKYNGYPVRQVKILLKSFNIYDTFSVSNFYLIVRWHNSQSQKIRINQKIQILNQYIKFPYPKQLTINNKQHILPPIQFIFFNQNSDKKADKLFIGLLPIQNLHKDYVYSQDIKLIFVKNRKLTLNNKGQNIISVQILLKSLKPQINNNNGNVFQSRLQATSNNQNLKLQKQYYLKQQYRLNQLYKNLLDYDLEYQCNDGVKELKKLSIIFDKMKNPIDQFIQQKDLQIKIPLFNDNTFPQVLMNSQLLIQHFKLLIYQTFPNNQHLKAKIPDLYKIFSKNTNYQMLFLTEILIQAILLDKQISFQQRINYLYCLGKHYQNVSGKGISLITIDYLFNYIYKIYGWINSIPYSKRGKGQILSAVIYNRKIKIQQDGFNITSILQDWAHISKIKFGYYGLVLGTNEYLIILQVLLSFSTRQQLKKSQTCRLQIIYRKQKSQYIYSASFNPKTFEIMTLGTKFLQKFPPKRQFNSLRMNTHLNQCRIKNLNQVEQCSNIRCEWQKINLDTTSQILFNSSQFISLQSNQTLTLQEFRQEIFKSPLLAYLLNHSSLYQPSVIKSQPINNNQKIRSNDFIDQYYNDWALFRYQNCIQEWRKCCIIDYLSQSKSIAIVKLPQNQTKQQRMVVQFLSKHKLIDDNQCEIKYQIPIFQLWSMQQNLNVKNSQQLMKQLDFIQNKMQNKYKKIKIVPKNNKQNVERKKIF